MYRTLSRGNAFTLFWGAESPFSQWHPARFVVDEVSFSCAEQYMMHAKALLFGDEASAEQILAAASPAEQKRLGRRVSGFREEPWNAERESIVYRGNHARFTQAPPLLEALLATAGTRLAEASPTDLVWGIGFRAEDPRAADPARWRGQNLLGNVLTRLRDDLLGR